MDLIWIIYFVDTFCGGSIHLLCGLIILIFTIFCFVFSIFKFVTSDIDTTTNSDVAFIHYVYKFLISRKVIYTILLLLLVFIFLPTKGTAYKMLAVHGVTELSNNEKVQQLSDKSIQVMEKVMDEYLNKDKNTN